jgi:hypothetical protein
MQLRYNKSLDRVLNGQLYLQETATFSTGPRRQRVLAAAPGNDSLAETL